MLIQPRAILLTISMSIVMPLSASSDSLAWMFAAAAEEDPLAVFSGEVAILYERINAVVKQLPLPGARGAAVAAQREPLIKALARHQITLEILNLRALDFRVDERNPQWHFMQRKFADCASAIRPFDAEIKRTISANSDLIDCERAELLRLARGAATKLSTQHARIALLLRHAEPVERDLVSQEEVDCRRAILRDREQAIAEMKRLKAVLSQTWTEAAAMRLKAMDDEWQRIFASPEAASIVRFKAERQRQLREAQRQAAIRQLQLMACRQAATVAAGYETSVLRRCRQQAKHPTAPTRTS